MVQLPVQATQILPEDESSDIPNWDILGEEWLSDEPELESDLHREQIDLLLRLLKEYWRDRQPVYCSGNTTVYYDEFQRTNRNFRGPDLFVVFGADPRPRKSWMIWREGGRYPNVVIELLSNSTAKVDRTEKKALYQDVWRLPNYFWFHPYTKELKGFRLVGRHYEEIVPNEFGHLWSDEMELGLGLQAGWLRLFTSSGELVLLPEERAQEQAEQERQRAEQERQRADRLAERLRELGIDPDE
jgi:Uma2 family endonuclease